MKTGLKILALAGAAFIILSATGCAKLKARDQLNKGVASYKNARYEQAIGHFKNAVELDPTLQNAKIYLATAYLAQYIPGVDSPENLQNANSAIDQYKSVLEQDPKNVNSIKGIAYLYLQMKKFDDAKTYYHKAIDLDPNDPEAYYSVGVIDWTQAYQPMAEERAKEGLKPDEPLKDKKLCTKRMNGWTRPWLRRRPKLKSKLVRRESLSISRNNLGKPTKPVASETGFLLMANFTLQAGNGRTT